MRGQSLYDYCMEHEEKKYLLDEWDYEKNSFYLGVTPKDVVRASNKKAYWKCNDCDYVFIQTICKRSGRGDNCPKCAIKKRGLTRSKNYVSFGNDLASNYPELLLDWDYTKNVVSPSKISMGSAKRVWWKCHKCGYEWDAIINNRSTHNRGCPQCAKEGRSSFPEQAIYFYLNREYKEVLNGSKDLLDGKLELDIFISEIKTAIEYDGVTWHKDIERDLKKNRLCQEKGIRLIRIREEGLSNIEGSVNIFRKDNSSDSDLEVVLRMLFSLLNIQVDVNIERDKQDIYSKYIQSKKENSLAVKFPEIAKEWHPTKNGSLSPENVSFASNKKVWWVCDKGHEWGAVVSSRINNIGCPFCSNKKVLRGYNDLVTTHPELVKEWDYEKNAIYPDSVVAGSNKSVWWICSDCGNTWKTQVRTRTSQGCDCLECSKRNRGITRSKNAAKNGSDLASNFPELLKEWNYDKNDILPDEISSHSNKKVWWKCVTCGHEWYAHVYSRTKGHGCPECGKKKCVETKRKNKLNSKL